MIREFIYLPTTIGTMFDPLFSFQNSIGLFIRMFLSIIIQECPLSSIGFFLGSFAIFVFSQSAGTAFNRSTSTLSTKHSTSSEPQFSICRIFCKFAQLEIDFKISRLSSSKNCKNYQYNFYLIILICLRKTLIGNDTCSVGYPCLFEKSFCLGTSC